MPNKPAAFKCFLGRELISLYDLLSLFFCNVKLILVMGKTAYSQDKKISKVLVRAMLLWSKEGFRGLAARIVRSRGEKNNYIKWVEQFDILTAGQRKKIAENISQMTALPLISILMPTYNSNPEWLEEAIASVRNQIYPNWQLCIADDASSDTETCKILRRAMSEDARIEVVFRTKNGHISAASNSALELVKGDWVALLDHDDLLSEHALFNVACVINEHPEVNLIYSDEDKIDSSGNRSGPYFKCDWNPDLFYSHNMICHLGVYKSEILRKISGFRLGYEGAQDYDLTLRYIEQIDHKTIFHIPRVLYHWRIHEGSTAGGSEAKPYAMLAGERALNDHFKRMGIRGSFKLDGHGYRATYNLPLNPPKVSILIPTKNGLSLLRKCVTSIIDLTSYKNYEIVVVDNGSDEVETCDYLEFLSENNIVNVVRDDRDFNYSALNNLAVTHATGEVVCLMNNDIEVVSPDWLTEMVSHALRPEIAAVGAKLLYPNDTLQHAGVICGIGGWAGHSHKGFPKNTLGYAGRASLVSNFSAVTGACLVIRRAVYISLGGLNEFDLAVACNDVDLCLRALAAGYRNVWTPYAILYHHESATRGYENNPVKQARFASEVGYMLNKWKERLAIDPYYSPNLTLDHEDFGLAWPPRVPPLI